MDEIIKSMVMLVDTREKQSSHILDWFEKKKISCKSKALSNGDYSFYVPMNSELNIERDLYFDKQIMIERKGSLEELSGNLTANRTRFEEEMATCKGKKYLLIEDASYQDVVEGKYDTQYSKNSFLASIHTFDHRYNLQIVFMPDRAYSATYIYGVFKYYLKNLIR